MAPLARRQLLTPGEISQAIQSRFSTASTGLFGLPTPVADPTPTVLPPAQSTAPVPQPQPTTTQTTPLDTLTLPSVSVSTNIVTQVVPPATPTVSVIILTTTTSSSSTPLISATPVVTSSSDPLTPSSVPPLVLTTPSPAITNVPTTRSLTSSPSPSTSGVSAGAGTGAETTSDKGMSGGIIALIIVGALLAALLAGAFTFRRVQVHRRAKRRENNYGAGPLADNPFPFTNVSETDMKGAEPITRDFRQGSASSFNEKPMLSVAPVIPTYAGNVNFNQPGFDRGMSGPYPSMGATAPYGYGQPARAASPASQAPRVASPAPPPVAAVRAGSPPFMGPATNQHPQSLVPALAPTPPPPAPAAAPALGDPLPAYMRGRKRVVQTFQPSLPDELDIREGDWVTIIHAYDDGWGLCERNGRRGVVPLECLDIGKPDLRASRRLSSLSAVRQ